MYKTTNNNTITILTLAVASILFVTLSSEAFGHASFQFVPGNGATGAGCTSGTCVSINHTVNFVLGETFEPAFVDTYHDAELTLTHILTNLRLGNAHKDQTAAASAASDFSSTGKVLKVDTYFYPSTKLVNTAGNLSPTGGVKHSIGNGDGSLADNPGANTVGLFCDTGTVSSGVLTGNSYNCVPNQGGTFGYTDKREGMFFRPLGAAEQSGSGLQYRQNTRQYYTEQGLTLYHVHGAINYFNDTGIGLTKINMWIDGRNVKTLSMAAANGANNRTYTVNSGFGLNNMTTSVYWPDADGGVTENTHPTNLRKAIGQIRDNTWDIWNVLEQISNGLNAITEFIPKVPDHVPRNYTNPGPTSSGQYTFP
jgi:hypothetical protein